MKGRSREVSKSIEECVIREQSYQPYISRPIPHKKTKVDEEKISWKGGGNADYIGLGGAHTRSVRAAPTGNCWDAGGRGGRPTEGIEGPDDEARTGTERDGGFTEEDEGF